MTSTSLVLYEFSTENSPSDWVVINDTVMGGRSQSTIKMSDEEAGLFEGHVSLENNGGFSMIQHQFKIKKVTDYSKAVFKIKGDGKNYQFRIKSSKNDRHSYIGNFSTTGKWQTITILFSEMYPAYRGRTLEIPNYPGEMVEHIAFLIGNKKEQDFRLKIDRIMLE